MPRLLKNKGNIILSASIALLLTIITSIFYFPKEKYTTKIVDSFRHSAKDIVVFEELYPNEQSTKIHFIKDFFGSSSIIFIHKKQEIAQWNINGKFAPCTFYCTGDINKDDVKELFVFSYKNDSIFLNGYDLLKKRQFIKCFVSKFDYFNDQIDFGCYNPQIVDFNNDGQKELLVNFYCAFSKTTRKICLIDLNERKVFCSPKAGFSICDNIILEDIDSDKIPEIFGDFPVYGNCPKQYPYSDQYGWLMIYNSQMNFKFPPKRINKASGAIYTRPIKTGNKFSIAVLSRNVSETDTSFIGIYSRKGDLIRKRPLINQNNMLSTQLKIVNSNLYIKYGFGLTEVYDTLLLKINKFKSHTFVDSNSKHIDLDNDGLKEEICTSANQDAIVISRNDYKYPVEVPVERYYSRNLYFSKNTISNKQSLLAISLDEWLYQVKYSKNRFYQFRLILFLLVLAAFYLLIFIIGKLFQSFLIKRYNAENRLREIQLTTLEQQISPHFTLNILNGIGSLYEKHETDTAQYYFGKYSKLLRNVLLSSGQIITTLDKELEFCQNYMELESFRLNQGFAFTINSPQDADKITIPKLLIHTFVENALKHGIKPLLGEKECKLKIDYKTQKDKIIISISDDGIGRTNAIKLKNTGTGKGLKIIKETIRLFEITQGPRISFQILDLDKTKSNTGTVILIDIPYNEHHGKN